MVSSEGKECLTLSPSILIIVGMRMLVATPIIITLIVIGENRNSMIKEPEKHLSVATKLKPC